MHATDVLAHQVCEFLSLGTIQRRDELAENPNDYRCLAINQPDAIRRAVDAAFPRNLPSRFF
jgi:hypothetical protein